MSNVLLDNDVVLKICCFDSSEELIGCLGEMKVPIAILGVGTFVVRKLAAKSKNIADHALVSKLVDLFLAEIIAIEPNDNELMLAAEFEESAQVLNLPLDSGESQLLAVLVKRSANLLATGDKRAIKAIPPVIEKQGLQTEVAGRIACLEQVVLELVNRHSAAHFQSRICKESGIDKSLAICFSCASGQLAPASVAQGLKSYINDLRNSASGILVDSDDLSAVIP